MENRRNGSSEFSDPRTLKTVYPDQYIFGVFKESTVKSGTDKIKVFCHGKDPKKVSLEAIDLIKKNVGEVVIFMTTSTQVKDAFSGVILDKRILKQPNSASQN